MPKFTTVISASGPLGNTMSMLGAARSMMRELNVSKRDIEDLTNSVMNAGSYAEACAAIQEWFPIQGMANDE